MIFKRIEKHLDMQSFKEGARKVGLTFITTGGLSLFLQHLIAVSLSLELGFLGLVIWTMGLIKRGEK